MTLKHPSAEIGGLRVGIVGMARSGVAAAKLVARHGGSPFVSDAGEAARLASNIDDLELVGIPCETGGHTDRVLEVDFIVVSPGVPLQVPVLAAARERGVPVYSELELGWWFCRAPVIAVTGSNGKTTTTSLIGHMLDTAGVETAVCGNIGLPFASVADTVPADGVAVVEVSSFQLETIDRFQPDVAVVLNLQPDHLDRHGSFDAYVAAKLRIAENQSDQDVYITNHDDEALQDISAPTAATRWTFTVGAEPNCESFVDHEWLHVQAQRTQGAGNAKPRTNPVIRVSDILLPGRHNLSNAAAACLACVAMDVPIATMSEALRSFRGVEHRLEPVGSVAGVRYVNDSKATNVDATCVALQAMDKPTILILGGVHKGSPYKPIVEASHGKLKAVVALGASRKIIVDDIGSSVDVHLVDDLEQAVCAATGLAEPGDTVMLSPACASFDMFENFEERGRAFKEAVTRLKLPPSRYEEK